MFLINAARKVHKEWTAGTIDGDTGEYRGDAFVRKRPQDIILDAYSASIIVRVYNALSRKNQERLAEMNATKAIQICWRLVK